MGSARIVICKSEIVSDGALYHSRYEWGQKTAAVIEFQEEQSNLCQEDPSILIENHLE